MTTYPVEHASFTRVDTAGLPLPLQGSVAVRHQDGTMTYFGSDAAFEIFKSGMAALTKFDMYDEVQERWLVGMVDQLAGN